VSWSKPQEISAILLLWTAILFPPLPVWLRQAANACQYAIDLLIKDTAHFIYLLPQAGYFDLFRGYAILFYVTSFFSHIL